jgi:hypothetical protein
VTDIVVTAFPSFSSPNLLMVIYSVTMIKDDPV